MHRYEKKKRWVEKMPFEHNLWVFMSFLRLSVVSISIQFSFYSIRTLPFPKKERTYNRTSSPSHFSLLIGAASIKKRTCSTFLSSFIFTSFFRIITFSMLCYGYDIYVQCCSLTESFMTFLSLFFLMDFYVLFQS